MRTIITCKVYETLDTNSAGRVIGWWKSLEDGLIALGEFGSESRWSYAVFEENSEGTHTISAQNLWLEYNDVYSRWQVLPREKRNEFTRCINHAIG